MDRIDLVCKMTEAYSLHTSFMDDKETYRRIYTFWDGDMVGVFCYVSELNEDIKKIVNQSMDEEAEWMHHQPYKHRFIWKSTNPRRWMMGRTATVKL